MLSLTLVTSLSSGLRLTSPTARRRRLQLHPRCRRLPCVHNQPLCSPRPLHPALYISRPAPALQNMDHRPLLLPHRPALPSHRTLPSSARGKGRYQSALLAVPDCWDYDSGGWGDLLESVEGGVAEVGRV